MTIQRIFFSALLVAGVPFLFTTSNAEVLSDNVAIDDYQVNPKDFPDTADTKDKPMIEEVKPTIIAACHPQTCKQDS